MHSADCHIGQGNVEREVRQTRKQYDAHDRQAEQRTDFYTDCRYHVIKRQHR